MSEDRMVPVYKTYDVGRAEVIRAALEGEGIQCAIENEHQAGLSGVLQCRLFVMEADEEDAKSFISEHEKKLHKS